jgi:enoyl-CoA hydratase
MFDNLLFAREGAVALLTLNRPQTLNALSLAILEDLQRAVALVRDDRDVRVVVITGAGEKAFAAGADIRELSSLSPAAMQAYARRGQRLFDDLETLGKPVLAAINGFALGGGCELALACTLRVASEAARLGQPEVHLGLMPGFGGTQRLPRLVGRGRALDLLLTGRQVDAHEALRIGLVDRIAAPASLISGTLELARTLAAGPPVAVRAILEAVHRGVDGALESGQALEAALFGVVGSTADMREGTAAFLGKRTPTFKGD